jgi:arsenate reductase
MLKVYGIKNCDTVKKACRWLESRGLSYQFHDFRIQGLPSTQVKTWIDKIGLDALVNKRSTTWKQLDDASRADLNEKTAVALLLANPTLIKRPLLEWSGRYHTGFSETEYQQLF